MANQSSSFTFSFTWTLEDFSIQPDLVLSPRFAAAVPFDQPGWKLWVYPHGHDRGSKGNLLLATTAR